MNDFTKEFRITFQRVKATPFRKFDLFIYHKFKCDSELNLLDEENLKIFDLDAHFKVRVRKDHYSHHFEVGRNNFLISESTVKLFK